MCTCDSSLGHRATLTGKCGGLPIELILEKGWRGLFRIAHSNRDIRETGYSLNLIRKKEVPCIQGGMNRVASLPTSFLEMD